MRYNVVNALLLLFLAKAVGFRSLVKAWPNKLGVSTNVFASVKVTLPSQEECVTLGIREWPQQTKSSAWQETVRGGQTVARYILQGTGSLVVDAGNEISIQAGTLVTVTDKANIEWRITGKKLIILTPGYEEGGKLALAGAVLVASIAAAFLLQ
jgi:uncharacterized cupin superfamily protein